MNFVVHPDELRRRRAKCKPVVDEVLNLGFEQVLTCNLCRSDKKFLISSRDRYGFHVRSAMCLDCGTVYLVDRLTNQGYARFYRHYYRDLISRFKGRPHVINQLLAGQKRWANSLIEHLRGHINLSDSSQVLDLGGSTGIVAGTFAATFGATATIVDPAAGELSFAKERGLRTIVGTIESFKSDRQYDLILMCKTFEHLYDLRKAFKNIRELLTPDGLLYCDIADLLEICRTQGAPEAVTKIDHCFWFGLDNAPDLFRSLGLEMLWAHFPDVVEPTVGYLLRPCHPEQLHVREEDVLSRLGCIQRIRSDWYHYGQHPLTRWDWLRGQAHRAKKWFQLRLP